MINRLPSTTSPAPTHHHSLFGTPPRYDHLRTSWPRSTRCVFLGYSPDHKGYRCLTSRWVLISRHVVFDESDFPFSTTSTPATDLGLKSLFPTDPVVQPPLSERSASPPPACFHDAPAPFPVVPVAPRGAPEFPAAPTSPAVPYAAPAPPTAPCAVSVPPLCHTMPRRPPRPQPHHVRPRRTRHRPLRHARPRGLPRTTHSPCASTSIVRRSPRRRPLRHARPQRLPRATHSLCASTSAVRHSPQLRHPPESPVPAPSSTPPAGPPPPAPPRHPCLTSRVEPAVYHPSALQRDPRHLHPIVTRQAAGVLWPAALSATAKEPGISPVPSSVHVALADPH